MSLYIILLHLGHSLPPSARDIFGVPYHIKSRIVTITLKREKMSALPHQRFSKTTFSIPLLPLMATTYILSFLFYFISYYKDEPFNSTSNFCWYRRCKKIDRDAYMSTWLIGWPFVAGCKAPTNPKLIRVQLFQPMGHISFDKNKPLKL